MEISPASAAPSPTNAATKVEPIPTVKAIDPGEKLWTAVGEDDLQFLNHAVEKIGDSARIVVKKWKWI
jgi:hypothetical protein